MFRQELSGARVVKLFSVKINYPIVKKKKKDLSILKNIIALHQFS